MEQHITGIYNITDGDLMLEVNALEDKICMCFQVVNKDRTPLDKFLEVLDEEDLKYKVSERKIKYLPKIELP